VSATEALLLSAHELSDEESDVERILAIGNDLTNNFGNIDPCGRDGGLQRAVCARRFIYEGCCFPRDTTFTAAVKGLVTVGGSWSWCFCSLRNKKTA